LLSTWYVNSANSGTINGQTAATGYVTIQAAISAASNGDTILVENGNGYAEQDTINKSLTIEAAPGQTPLNQGNGTGVGFTVESGVTGVTISGLAIGNFAQGVVVGSSASATITNNEIGLCCQTFGGPFIEHDGNGIVVDPSGSATITGNQIWGTNDGIDVAGTATIGGTGAGAGNIIIGNFGVEFANGGSGSLEGNYGQPFGTEPYIAGDSADLYIASNAGPVSLGVSSPNTFVGHRAGSGVYIDNASPQTIDATDSTFQVVPLSSNLFDPATADLAAQFTIQSQIDDGLNTRGTGLVQIVKNQLFVVPAAEQSAPGAIQRAVNLAAAGDTINIAPGTYPGPVNITQDVTLAGTGATSVAISSGGPVITVPSGVTATVDGLTVSGGSAADGGGIANAGILNIANAAVTENSATVNGGGVENAVGATLTVVDSTVSNNRATGSGGGIDNQGTVTVVNSTIANNSAAAGGGISDEGSLTGVNTTVAYNTTSGGYGSGGGLDVGGAGAAILYNTIVVLDTDAIGADDVGGTGIASSSSNNLVGVDDTGTVAGSLSPFVVGGVNPGLASGLAYSGGPTQTIGIVASTSPALNSGSNSRAAVYGVTTDQRGATRGPDGGLYAGTVVDIGAYEASSSYLVTSASDATDAGTFQAAASWANLSNNVNSANLAAPAPNTVTFAATSAFASQHTIGFLPGFGTLDVSNSAGELIEGPGANLVTINAYGAARVFQVSGGVTATLSGLTITGSSKVGVANMGSLTLTGCEVTSDGSGIDNSGMLAVADSTIAYDAPGIDNELGATLTLTNSTITLNGGQNPAPAGSGGVDNFGTLTAVNTTIADNQGSGLDDEQECTPATLYNTIVALNQLAGPFADTYGDISGKVSSASSYNLIGPGGSGGLTDADGHHNEVNVLDPGLAPAPFQAFTWSGNNGGPTQTIALLPGSRAIDAGSLALASQYGLATDQRGAGFPRVVNGVVDIGAFESPVFGRPAVYMVTNTSNDASVAGSLPWAINQANHQGNPGYSPANPAGSQVTFAIPTSDPHYDASTKSWTITLSSTLGLFEEDGPEVIQGPGANALTVSGNHTVEVFFVDGNTAATISGLTVSGGTNDTGFSAIINEPTEGGGICNNGKLTVSNCVVSGNSDPNVGGGGICNNGVLTVADSKIAGNYGYNGGGIFNQWVMTVSDSEIDCNSAFDSGGILNSVGVATIMDSTIAGNRAAQGGGVANFGGSLGVIGSAIADNSATAATAGSGGGLIAGGSTQVTDSTIANNTARVGGGIFVSGGALTITDSTIAGNTATSAGSGGGLWDSGGAPAPSILDNSIVAGNMGPNGSDDIDGLRLSPDSSNNLIDDPASAGGLINDTNGNIIGDGSGHPIDITTVFQTTTDASGHPVPVLAYNGGLTQTIALLRGSPAIGAGSVNLIPIDPATGNPIATDQRGPGYQRTVTVNGNPTVDIGAYQTQQVPTSTSVTSTSNPSVSGQSVTFAVAVSPLASRGGTPTGTVTFMDGTTVLDTETLSGGTASFTTAALPAGSHAITAAYSGDPDHFASTSAALTQQVDDLNAANLASVVTAAQTSGGTVTLTAATTTTLTNTLSTITSLPTNTTGAVVVDLSANATYQQQDSGGDTIPIVASAPSGTTLTIRCSIGNATVYDLQAAGGNVDIHGSANGTITVVGTSPALKVTGGSVTIGSGVTLVTATASPTILVSGGSLTIRNATIQESTGSTQAAILITGGSVDLGTTTSPGGNVFNVNGAGTLIQNTSASPVPAVGDTFENNGAPITSSFGVVSLSAPSAQTANQGVPKSFTPGSLTDTVNDSQSWTVDVNWGDGSAHTGFSATTTGALSAQSHVFALPGTYTVTVTAADPVASGVAAWSLVRTFTISVAPSLFVLSSNANGALNVSANASIKIPGAIVVDSSSTTAISASGNSQLTASVIDVAGGVQKAGTATISPVPATGVSLNDPLTSLSGPNPSGTFTPVSLTKGSQTITPGVYSQISVSGSASLTLSPGIYIIDGGGLTVTGSASISGTGVTIYNAGSNYPNSGGNFGGITLSGSGTFNLSAPTTGAYAGIVIFQSRQNARALSLSGNAMAGLSGTIYAANALLSMSGNASITNPLIVSMLNLSGNVSLTQTAAGSDGTGDTSGIANTLLAGELSVYINDPSGLFTQDELSRIQDAINTWNTLLAPYSVTISEVTDPTLANMVIDIGTSSACGGMANGVLGCFNAPNSEITLIQGWNWYAGADPTQIGAGQYDFETTVLHELGHALGLGGSTNSSSPMYEILASGVADRTATVADLNIPDPPEGADPQMAAGFHLGATAMANAQNGVAVVAGTGGSASGPLSVPPRPLTVVGDSSPAVAGQGAAASSQQSIVNSQAITSVGSQVSVAFQAIDPDSEQRLIPWVNAESTEFVPALDSAGRDGAASEHGQPALDVSPDPAHPVILNRDQIDNEHDPNSTPIGPTIPGQRTTDSALSDLANEMVLLHGQNAAKLLAHPVLLAGNAVITEDGQAATKSEPDEFQDVPVLTDPMAQEKRAPRSAPFAARLAAILLLANLSGRPIASKNRKTFRNDQYWNKEARSKKE
jgi:hypothetical protein